MKIVLYDEKNIYKILRHFADRENYENVFINPQNKEINKDVFKLFYQNNWNENFNLGLCISKITKNNILNLLNYNNYIKNVLFDFRYENGINDKDFLIIYNYCKEFDLKMYCFKNTLDLKRYKKIEEIDYEI